MSRSPSPRLLAAVFVVGFGATFLGLTELNNGLLTQIRTGTEILRSSHVRTSDPYSFTALGHPWTDQSWLPELTYGMANKLGGLRAVILENLFVGALTLVMLVRLCWQRTAARLIVAAGAATAFLIPQWQIRPVAFALLWFALVIFIFQRKSSPWFLIPIGWLWVNSHGSFIIGVAWTIAFAGGEWFDERRRNQGTEKRLLSFIVGVLLGAISPVGPKILGFWLIPLGSRAQFFKSVGDWQSLNFYSSGGTVLAIGLITVLCFGFSHCRQWRYRLPVLGLAAATLMSGRQLPFLAVALGPFLAVAIANVTIRESKTTLGATALPGATLAAVFLSVLVFTARATQPVSQDVSNYPVKPVTWLADHGLMNGRYRIAGREEVGNVIEWRYGTKVPVFMDDRFDMFPPSVLNDDQALLLLSTDPDPILAKYKIDVVVAQQQAPLSVYLKTDAAWDETHQDTRWAIFQKR